MNQLQYNL